MWPSVFSCGQASFSGPIQTVSYLPFWNPKFWRLKVFYKYFAIKHYLTWHEAFSSLYPFSVDGFVGYCINIYICSPWPHWGHDLSKIKGNKERKRKEGGREERKERRKKGRERGENSKAQALKLPDTDWETVPLCWWHHMDIQVVFISIKPWVLLVDWWPIAKLVKTPTLSLVSRQPLLPLLST